MKSEIRTILRSFASCLKDEPLEPDNMCYVSRFVHADGTSDPIMELVNRISFSEFESVTFLSGRRGSGKSTELRRLRKNLEADGCMVFLIDMRDYMNMTTSVEVSDFFISIMGALNESFYEKFMKYPTKESYWKQLVNFLNSNIEGITIEATTSEIIGGIKAHLKNDPTFRRVLQNGLKGHIARIVQDAYDFAISVVEAVRRETNDPEKKVVFLIDSLEQIRGIGADADSVRRSVENLYSAHADSLHIPNLHILYTAPSYLIQLSSVLERHLGSGVICHLPCVYVFKNRSENKDADGLNIMKKIVSCRFPEWEKVITAPHLERMAIVSGGNFRNFFRLITIALTKTDGESLPIGECIVTAAEDHFRRDMLPIAVDDMGWRKRIFVSYAKEDSAHARKLYAALARDGYEPWLDEENILPGQKWEIAIDDAINESEYFIALLSSNSVEKRGYVQKELRKALDILDLMPEKHIFIIPVRLDDCIPNHPLIEKLHWLDMFCGNEEAWWKAYNKIEIAIRQGQIKRQT